MDAARAVVYCRLHRGNTKILDLLFNWSDALRFGMDVVAYLIMALVGTTFFVLRLAISRFFGGDTGDVGHADTAFNMFSLLSILVLVKGAS
jgi:cobalamin synthase